MFEIKKNEKKDVLISVKTLVVDPEEFDGIDADIVSILKKIVDEQALSAREIDKMLNFEEKNEITLNTEAIAQIDSTGNVEISYIENENDEQIATRSKIVFPLDNPNLVSITKEGAISTYLSFEEGKTHICTYDTPFMPFRVYVQSKKVDNKLLCGGELYLNYILNLNDTPPQHFIITVSIKDAPEDILKDFLS